MMQLIIFEGVSGSGKTTLFAPVHEARGYEDLHIHRFTPTHWVYSILHARPVDLGQLHRVEEALMRRIPTLVVWCRPQPPEALRRAVAKGDTRLLEGDFARADYLFEVYFRDYTKFDRVLELDTGALTIDQCVQRVVEALEGVEQ